MDFHIEGVTAETLILGFTGALGSGATFFAKNLAEERSLLYCSLSEPIHEIARAEGFPESFEVLQNIGNRLRATGKRDILVRLALEKAEKEFEGGSAIVLDGIRNTAEVTALQQFPNFYLISVQADYETRKARLLKAGRCREAEFTKADKRDSEERDAWGQQVNKCNDLADIVIVNDEHVPTESPKRLKEYLNKKLIERYVSHCDLLAKGNAKDYPPTDSEALMTAAYVQSRRSSCLKRKVGALIATSKGQIIASGHNEVPEGSKPCLQDPEYEWCARDVLQERVGQRIRHCPQCGHAISLSAKCRECGKEIAQYYKRCPSCKEDPGVDYECPECKCKVFSEFIPGKGRDVGRMLDMCRAVHAEENAILSLSRSGVALPSDAVLYTTTFPCNLCANKIVMAGIKKVVFAEPYVTKEAKRILESNDVTLERFEGVKSRAYFRFYG